MLAFYNKSVDHGVMKYLILGAVFVALPYVLLSAFVMPALDALQETYSNAGTIAERVASE